ncbi:MAG: response regulator [Lachnospiraceae bacterium]|nr:response regulator [Lachnospiraceae bacterium]
MKKREGSISQFHRRKALGLITGLYIFAAITGVFSRVRLQNEMLNTVEKEIRSYAELGIFGLGGSRSDPQGMEDLGKFLEKQYSEVTYIGIDNSIGSVIISDKDYYRGKVSDEMNEKLRSMTEGIDKGEADAKYFRVDGGRYFLFTALSHDGRYTFKGFIPYEAALEDVKNIKGVFVAAIFAIVLVATGMAFSILKLDRESELAQEAEDARKRAEQANQAKTGFLANMSHEIRTPINAILGMNEMIFRDTHEDVIRDYSRNVDTAASNLLLLINDILDFSKIEEGKVELIEAEYELSGMLNDMYLMIYMRAEQKGLSFDMTVDPDTPERLYGDKLRVQQCITNLLTNAVKYTERGSVKFRVGYEPAGEKRMILTAVVEDTGKGIETDKQKLIFDKFQRVDMKNNNTIEGTGLGLSITKTLLDMMGGTISLKSVYGAGSVFTVRIPQSYIGTEPIGNLDERIKTMLEDKKITEASFTAPEARVLVVDDTAINLQVVKNLLKKTGIYVDTVLSGKECLEILKDNRYDIILLDARMPDMDGEETLTHIRSMGLCEPSCTIIALTANVVAGAKEHYMECGFDDYLPKPVRPVDLESMLLKYLPIDKVELTEEDASAGMYSADIPDWLKKNRELNIDLGLELCGNAEIYMDTVTRFESHAAETMQAISMSLSEGRLDTFVTKVHALKSSARLIGAERLSALAAALEEAGDDGNMDYIVQHMGPMMSLFGELRESLSPLLKQEKAEKEGEIEAEALTGLYAHLRGYIEDFNSEAVGSMIRALDHYTFPGKEQDRFNELKRAYEAMDWVAMMSLFDENGEENG